MRRPADPFTPPPPDNDPFHAADRILVVRCTECFHVMGVLEVLRDGMGEPMPSPDDVDAVLDAAYWATAGFPMRCPHTDRLPPVLNLRSWVVRALRQGLTYRAAPVTVRI